MEVKKMLLGQQPRGRTVRVETVGTPIYEATKAETGIDPETLFADDRHPEGCACRWAGHKIFAFRGVGGSDAEPTALIPVSPGSGR